MLKKLAAAVASLGFIAVSIVGGAAAPAKAASISDAFDLWNYVLTIKGSQLQSIMGPAANAAWSSQSAAQAAASAAYSSVAQVHGNIPFDKMGEVIPLKEPVSPIGAGQKLGPIRLPAFPMNNFMKVTPASGLAAGVAVTAYAYRGDIAGGVLRLVGIDAQANVCANVGDDFGGVLLNILSGQDCSMYAVADAYPINTEVVPRPDGWSATIYRTGSANSSGAYYFQCVVSPVVISGQVVTIACTEGGSHYGGSSTGAQGGVYDSARFWCKTSTSYVLAQVRNGMTEASSFTSQSASANALWVNPTGTDQRTFRANAPGRTGISVYKCPTGSTPYSFVPSTSTDPAVGPNTTPPSTHAFWASSDSPHYLAGVDADPERWLTCHLTGSDGITRTAQSSTFRESDGAWPEPNCPTLPAGVYATNVQITSDWSGGSTPLYDEDADPAYLDWQENDAARCADRDCVLDLVYLPTGLSCFGMGDQCNGWMQSPTRDTDYQCQYGGEAQPIQECYVYAQVFDPVRRLDGMPYADPKTGDELGTTTGLRYDEQLMGRPGQDPTMKRACGGSGTFTLNPLDFVLRPIQCALEWAFVPRPAIVNGYGNEVKNTLNDRAPGQIATVVAGWSIAPVMTGCKIEFTHWTTGQSMPIVDACSGPMAVVATISRFVTAAGMVVLAVALIRRQIAGVVDFKGN